jgi:hypothetical protein
VPTETEILISEHPIRLVQEAVQVKVLAENLARPV